MRKILTVLVTAILLVSVLAACAPAPTTTTAPTSTPAPTSGPQVTLSPDGKYPAETVKIGLEVYDTTAELTLQMQQYFKYMQKAYNIEIITSESIADAAGELAFIESCAAAGCKAIIAGYNVTQGQAVQRTIDLGMYYWGTANEPAVYDAFKSNPMYLGGVKAENADYQIGVNVAQALIDAGCKKLVFTSGGADFGIQMFVDRKKGFTDTVAKASGVTIVADVAGWPGTESFAAAQTAALGMDVDGIASGYTALPWLGALGASGKMGQVKIASNETVNATLFDLMSNGAIFYSYSEIAQSFGVAVPMILNAVAGHADKYLMDGAAPQVPMGYWTIANKEDCAYYVTFSGNPKWVWTNDDIKTVLYEYNNAANYDSFKTLFGAYDRASIEARNK
jgi:hypothetical protein